MDFEQPASQSRHPFPVREVREVRSGRDGVEGGGDMNTYRFGAYDRLLDDLPPEIADRERAVIGSGGTERFFLTHYGLSEGFATIDSRPVWVRVVYALAGLLGLLILFVLTRKATRSEPKSET